MSEEEELVAEFRREGARIIGPWTESIHSKISVGRSPQFVLRLAAMLSADLLANTILSLTEPDTKRGVSLQVVQGFLDAYRDMIENGSTLVEMLERDKRNDN